MTQEKKKPTFVRKDTYKKARVKFKWRKPKGKHSPVRQKHKGRPKLVSIGYGSKKEETINPIKNIKEIADLKKITISGKISDKNKIIIIQEAIKNNIEISNINDPKKKLEELENKFNSRKNSKKKKVEEKSKKEKAKEEEKKLKEEKLEKKKPENKEEDKKIEEKSEEQKKEDKKMMEKTLIKKQ